MKRFLTAIVVLAAVFGAFSGAEARHRLPAPDAAIQLAQERDVAISPGEAADIAQSALPGSRVLKVKLLPSGVYAVTLKTDDRVERVMVDAQTGSVL